MIMQPREYPGVGDMLWSGRLPNGLAIRVVPRPGFQKKQAFMAVNYGGAMRNFTLDGRRVETPAGVAHFLEHKMFDLPEGNALNILSARGAEANAYTGGDMTAYYFECDEGFGENLELLIKFVTTPYFTEESVAKEQGIIGQEIRMTEDDPSFVLYTATMGALFDHHPVRESVAGTVESIARITPQTLYDCHRAFYVPANMALCVVGDVDPEYVAETAARLTAPERLSAAAPDYGEREGLEPITRRAERGMDVSDPMFIAAAKLSTDLGRGDEALRLATVGSLAARCLLGAGSGFYTSLYAEGLLRGDFFRDVSPLAGTLLFECGGTTSQPEQVFDRLCAALGEAAEKGIDPDALERARRAEYGISLRSLNDPGSVCAALARSCFGGYGFYEGFDVLGAVTAEDANAFVREYLRPERLVLSLILPK